MLTLLAVIAVLIGCGSDKPTELSSGDYFQTEPCTDNQWEWIKIDKAASSLTRYHQLDSNCWQFEHYRYRMDNLESVALKPFWISRQGYSCEHVTPIMTGDEAVHTLELDNESFKLAGCEYRIKE